MLFSHFADVKILKFRSACTRRFQNHLQSCSCALFVTWRKHFRQAEREKAWCSCSGVVRYARFSLTRFCRGEVVLDNCLIVSSVKSEGSPITDLKSAFGSDCNTQRVVYYKLNKSIRSPTIFRWASGTCASGACASGIAAEARRPAEVRNRRRPP